MLRERAKFLLDDSGARPSIESLADRILAGLQRCAARGVTTIHDIVVHRDELPAYQYLAREERLPIRVQLLVRIIESAFSKNRLLELGLLHGFGSGMLRLGGIKISVDGGFTGGTGAFSDPLSSNSRHAPRGIIRVGQDELDETVWQYHEMGMRCCVHAIGDEAMDMVLSAYDKALIKVAA